MSFYLGHLWQEESMNLVGYYDISPLIKTSYIETEYIDMYVVCPSPPTPPCCVESSACPFEMLFGVFI